MHRNTRLSWLNRKGAKTLIMGATLEPFICPSLARGIRRAYLDSLDRNWAVFRAREAADTLRNPVQRLRTHKAFVREIDRICKRRMPRFLSISDMRVSAGHKEAWFALTLERTDSDAVGAGNARVIAEVMTYPRIRQWRSTLPIVFTGHAIDRLIQRAGVVDIPLSDGDLNAIHAGFASALIWVAAALKAIEEIDETAASELNLIIPAEHGIFLGCYETKTSQLVIKTFVDSSKLWEEELYALDKLNSTSEDKLAVSVMDLLATGWIAHDDTHVSELLIDVWQTFGWTIQEREDRPSKMNSAWL